MDQLPELALTELFAVLPLYDQLKIRSVCKQWKAIAENQLSGRKELVFFYRAVARPLIWFHSQRPVNLLNSIIVNRKFTKKITKKEHFEPLFNKIEQLFKQIERLYVITHPEFLESNFINFANRFRHLKHFQVDTLVDTISAPFTLKIQLNLPNLKSFCFNHLCFQSARYTKLIQLDCPKLEKLSVPCGFQLDAKCKFRNSLKFLKLFSIEYEPGFELPNLEVLLCQKVQQIDFSLFEKLKEIHFFRDWGNSIGYENSDKRLAKRNLLDGLFQQRNLLGRNELAIYYGSHPGTPGSANLYRTESVEIFENDFEDLKDLKLEFKGKKISLYDDDFDAEITAIDTEQAERLARCLVEVELSETILDKELDGKFKMVFKYVQLLVLRRDFRNQNNLDRLPDLFPHLVKLKDDLHENNVMHAMGCPSLLPGFFSERMVDLRFLVRFKMLQKLESKNWRFSASELSETLKNCPLLEDVRIYFAKLEKLPNGETLTKLARIYISIGENEYTVSNYERKRLIGITGFKDKYSSSKKKLHSSLEALVDCLHQKGHLRKEIE